MVIKGQPYCSHYQEPSNKRCKNGLGAHTTAPHEIIYDTPEQSFGTAVSVASTMTVSPPSIQTNVSDSTTQTTTSTPPTTGTTDTPNQQTSDRVTLLLQ